MSFFITFEGIEGCGKSTQARLLAAQLRRGGQDCLLTREPGGTRIGKEIRQIILDPRHTRMSPETELGLYFADRAQHLRQIVWPALDASKLVLCDRYTDSTFAYQGYGRGIPLKLIRSLDRVMTGSFRPRFTVLLDLPAQEGLTRALQRNKSKAAFAKEGRFEQEHLDFHERVRRGYLRMARREPGRYVVVSASGTRRQVQQAVANALRKRSSKFSKLHAE